MITAPATPAAPHSRITPGTVAAGVTTTAKSDLAGRIRERRIGGNAQYLAPVRIHTAERAGKTAFDEILDDGAPDAALAFGGADHSDRLGPENDVERIRLAAKNVVGADR